MPLLAAGKTGLSGLFIPLRDIERTATRSACQRAAGTIPGGELKRFGSLQVDHQLESCRLLDRQVRGLRAFQNLVHVGNGATDHLVDIRTIGQKSTGLRPSAPAA